MLIRKSGWWDKLWFWRHFIDALIAIFIKCLLLLFFKIYLFYVFECSLCLYACGADPIRDSFETPCHCWELNSSPLEEQPVLLSTQSSFLQPPTTIIFKCSVYTFLNSYLFSSVCVCMCVCVCIQERVEVRGQQRMNSGSSSAVIGDCAFIS